MKIIAIGCSPSDLEIGCFGTLSKFFSKGHQVHLIITAKKSTWSKKLITSFNELCKKVGVSEVFFTDKFDCSAVTQENVFTLRSFIEPINPEIVLFPSPFGVDKNEVILGRSSLLACRAVGNILMYESNVNQNFSPRIYSMVDYPAKIEKRLARDKRNAQNNKTRKKIRKLSKIYSKSVGLNIPVEAFDSNRILLLNNDIF